MIPIVYCIGYIYFDSIADTPVHDTYVIKYKTYIYLLLSVLLLISGMGYLFKVQNFKSKLILLHMITTFVGVLLLVLPNLYFLIFSSKTPRRYYSNNIELSFFEYLAEMNFISQFAMVLIILGVITYFINLGLAIVKK